MATERAKPDRREAYRHCQDITTRWMDNDPYGHVNNVVYYSYIDTVVNTYLIGQGWLDIANSPVIGLAVESHCNYFSALAYPDIVRAGLRVGHLGTSSVRYEIGLFRNDEEIASAQGHFVHVYVERATGKPVKLPEKLVAVLKPLLVP
jgi:acyl-CoA thioester hydrolase